MFADDNRLKEGKGRYRYMLRIDFNLVLTIINLIVLYLILRKFLFRPVMDIMEKREKMIADGISHANEEQDKAML